MKHFRFHWISSTEKINITLLNHSKGNNKYEKRNRNLQSLLIIPTICPGKRKELKPCHDLSRARFCQIEKENKTNLQKTVGGGEKGKKNLLKMLWQRALANIFAVSASSSKDKKFLLLIFDFALFCSSTVRVLEWCCM